MTMHPLDIIKRDMAAARYLTEQVKRPMPEPQPRPSLFCRLFRRRRDEEIRQTMPWLVASGAIVPGEMYRGRK